MLKYPVLRNGLIISVLLVACLPLYMAFVAYPTVSRLSVSQAEAEAVRIANYMVAGFQQKSALSDDAFLRSTDFVSRVKEISRAFSLIKFKVFTSRGEIVQASDTADLGEINTKSYFKNIVAAGGVFTKVVDKNRKSLEGEIFQVDIMETYVPILRDGRFAGAFEIYVDITGTLNGLKKAAISSSAVLFSVALLLLVMVFIGLRRQAQRLDRQEEIERSTRENEARLQTIMSLSLDAIISTDPEGKIVTLNEAALELFGHQENELYGKELSEIVFPANRIRNNRDERTRFIETLMGPVMSRRFEITSARPNGQIVNFEVAMSKRDAGPKSVTTVFIRDITEISLARKKIEYLAEHDGLTGLANRRMLKIAFKGALARAKRSQKKCAILSLDLDNFKPINDTLGHQAGDQVLKDTAKRFAHALRESDTVARVGGDEFVILLENLEGPEYAAEVAKKLLHLVQQPLRLEGQKAQIGVSIGISMYPENGSDLRELLAMSDKALYAVKREGKNAYAFS